ncbi:MAG: GNAT family N-acetyltransferase [Acidobacteriota bacterium]|jgi:GNAT superfamily N-acetyltransferase|nr:GNAT family N-acetyltransferase [Acidobacteriota bacterium]
MNTNFVITDAVKDDVPVLYAMIRELAEFEHLAAALQVTTESLGDALFGDKPAAAALIGRLDGAIVGYAVWYRTFSTFVGRPGVFLEDLYVRPEYRNRGFGRELLETALRVGGGDDPGRYEWITLRWNESALNFYRKLGARLLNEWVGVRMSGKPLEKLMGR